MEKFSQGVFTHGANISESIGTKEKRKEFNSHRTCLEHQHAV